MAAPRPPLSQRDVDGPLITPDDRYMIVRGRLWRRSNPMLSDRVRSALVADLMAARRDVAAALKASDAPVLAAARRAVDAAKTALGERGPVWWSDGSPDLTRTLVHNTGYRSWYASLQRNGPSLAERS